MRRVLWLYNQAYDSAEKQGAYCLATRTFLTELRFTHYEAYDACCQDIACCIIGG